LIIDLIKNDRFDCCATGVVISEGSLYSYEKKSQKLSSAGVPFVLTGSLLINTPPCGWRNTYGTLAELNFERFFT